MKKDPQAVALVHMADCTNGRHVKESQRVAADRYANCQLYQGKAADANEGCSLYAGKVVVANAWSRSLSDLSYSARHD